MLEDLFKQNKLEYVNINTERGKNIVLDIIVNKNIENLRYLQIKVENIRYEVNLDIS